VFALDPHGVYRAEALSAIPGLIHGFGTRNSEGWPDPPTATVRQVHSDRVVFADKPGVHGEADALVTNLPGFALAIRTADCVPIMIADPTTPSLPFMSGGEGPSPKSCQKLWPTCRSDTTLSRQTCWWRSVPLLVCAVSKWDPKWRFNSANRPRKRTSIWWMRTGSKRCEREFPEAGSRCSGDVPVARLRYFTHIGGTRSSQAGW